jgi:SSS family solute:Na+ symporter
MFTEDLYRKVIAPAASDRQLLRIARIGLVVVTGLGLLLALGQANSLILEWSFLSMGLRGATICFPLLGAILLPGYISCRAGVWAIALGPASAILWAIGGVDSVDPLYIGLLVSLATLAVGSLLARRVGGWVSLRSTQRKT